MSTHHTACPLDCPSCCGLEVTADGNRLVAIRGRKDHPFTQGIICGKVRRYEQIHHGTRVLEPLLRDGPRGTFREASWNEALDRVAARLSEIGTQYGTEAVLPFYYGGTLGVVQQKAVERLAHRAGWSRLDRTLCTTIAEASWKAGVGEVTGPRPQEIERSDLVILWGINAVSTHVNLMTFVKRARRAGATLVVIDPVRTRTAGLADIHIAPRPGTDGALACALMQATLDQGAADLDYLAKQTDFDDGVAQHLSSRSPEWAAAITGVAAETIRDLAERYMRAERPFIRVGIGMSRQRNGAVNLHAISCLPAIAGVWPRVGAGALLGTDAGFTGINNEAVRQTRWRTDNRELDMSQLGRWLTDDTLSPPVAALVVFNANPAGSCPDLVRVRNGLARDDLFTVVHEQVMTDTARAADVVLPATTFLEHSDLYASYGQYTLQLGEKVFAQPRGNARCNHDVINDLARRMGFNDDAFSRDVDDTIDRVLADSQLTRDQIREHGWLDCGPSEDDGHFRNGFPQPDGRFHFYAGWSDATMPALPDHWPVRCADDHEHAGYPLAFMAPPAHDVLNTTFTATERAAQKHGPPQLVLHPVDANARRINDGDLVSVFNARARLTMTARVSDEVLPGLCLCEANHLGAAFPEGVSLNALSHDHPVAPAGGPAFHDNRVQVEPAPTTPRAL
jgi:anaerobic selenocysteine-containing dehydrogenase